MCSAAEITDILEIRLSKKRFQHSLNVAEEAGKLAEKFDYPDKEKAYLTGLLHDICKEIPKEEQLEMVKKSKLNVSEVELGTPPLFHAVAGAWYAENVLNIHDDDMLNAVRYHTVGRAGMSKLASPEGCGCKSGIAPVPEHKCPKRLRKTQKTIISFS